MSLIPAESTFQLAALLLGLVAFGFWAETTRHGSRLSGALIVLLLGMVLSNTKLIPHTAPLYASVASWLVPLAIPMLLFRADLRQVLSEIGPMLKSFVAAATVITVTVIALSLAFDFGENESKFSGILVASYIGGALNFVATAEAVELTESNQTAAAFTAITAGVVLFLAILAWLPYLRFANQVMPSRFIRDASDDSSDSARACLSNEDPGFNIGGLVIALATSASVCALAHLLVRSLQVENLFILFVTAISLVVASTCKPLVARFNAEFRVGTFFLYLFFATIGAAADFASLPGLALPYAIMVCAVIVVFFILILIVGSILKLDLAELVIASNACILGPATAAAMAAGLGWKELVTPGVLAGILGYSTATFVGVAVAHLLT